MNDPGDSTLTASVEDSTSGSEPPERLSVVIVHEAGDWSAFAESKRAIETAAAALAEHSRCGDARGAEASVVLADDALVRTLNQTYRGKDKSTNVLSFPFQVPSGGDRNGILGDVVLAAETVAREAAERGIPPVHHLQHLVIHGLLHLLGFEHDTDPAAEMMERLETEILATLAIADPYASCGIE
jgi:probable rRNA maturation factor